MMRMPRGSGSTWGAVAACAILTCAVVACTGTGAAAQQSAPPQQVMTAGGPRSSDELVSLRRDMTWGEALEAIQRAARQVIVYPAGAEKEIGVGVFNQPWAQALELLLNANHLERVEREGYWEIIEPVAGVAGKPAEFSLKSRQVRISAVFFVADRSALREIGVDWATIEGGVVTASGPEAALSGLMEGGDTGALAGVSGAREVSNDVFQAAVGHEGKVGGHQYRVQALLKAFETHSLGEIIASPQITVVDGRQGVVYVGRDFATTVTDFAGNAITRFHSTGTRLEVTPRVITESGVDFIHLAIGTERSALIDPVQQIIDKTEASSEVLLYDGEETAIGGLFQVEKTRLRSGVPGLKDLPPWFLGLRYLFGYNRVQDVNKELIILLKAELVPTIETRIQSKLEMQDRSALQDKRREFDEMRAREMPEEP